MVPPVTGLELEPPPLLTVDALADLPAAPFFAGEGFDVDLVPTFFTSSVAGLTALLEILRSPAFLPFL